MKQHTKRFISLLAALLMVFNIILPTGAIAIEDDFTKAPGGYAPVLKIKYENGASSMGTGQYYAIVYAYGNNNPGYQWTYLVEIPANNSDISLNGNWSDSNGTYSSSWVLDHVEIVQISDGITVNDSSQKLNKGDYESYFYSESLNNIWDFKGFKTNPDGKTEGELKIQSFKAEAQLTPLGILGKEAVNFGVAADTFAPTGSHAESNFAAKTYTRNGNIDIGGAGDSAIPFYVGSITNVLRFGSITNVDVDVF